MSSQFVTATIDGQTLKPNELKFGSKTIYYIEYKGERYASHTADGSPYYYVYFNALSEMINNKRAFPHMKFPEICNLWNLWYSDNWEDVNNIKIIKDVCEHAINRESIKTIKFPMNIRGEVQWPGSRNMSQTNFTHLDFVLWDLYLHDVERRDEIMSHLKYPPIDEHERKIKELHLQCEKEKEELIQYYETQMEDLKKKLADLTSAVQIIKTIE